MKDGIMDFLNGPFTFLVGAALGAGVMYAAMKPAEAIQYPIVGGYEVSTFSPDCRVDWAPVTKIVLCQSNTLSYSTTYAPSYSYSYGQHPITRV